MSWTDRELGIHRDITRRDFLSGVAIGLAAPFAAPSGLSAALVAHGGQSPEEAPGYYPPGLTGMGGSHAGSFEVVHSSATVAAGLATRKIPASTTTS